MKFFLKSFKYIGPFLILLSVFLGFFGDYFFQKKQLVYSVNDHFFDQSVSKNEFPERFEIPDDQVLFLPYNKYVFSAYKKGELPFWNYDIGTGDTIIGNVQSVLFDPFFALGSLVFDDFYDLWSYRIIFLNFFGLLFFVVFLKRILIGNEGVILGGVFYIILTFYAQDFVITLSRTFFLVSLVSLDYLKSKKQFKFAVLLIFSLAIPFLMGDLQMAIHTWCSIFFIYILSEKRENLWGVKHYWIWPTSLLLVAFNLLPIWNTVKRSLRDHSVDIFSQSVRDMDWLSQWFLTYIGWLGILCLLASILSTKKYSKQIILLTVISLLYSTVSYLNQLIGLIIPLVKSLQIANYFFIIPLSVTLPILISIGFDKILNLIKMKISVSGVGVILLAAFLGLSFNNIYYSFTNSRDMFSIRKDFLADPPQCIKRLAKVINNERVLLFDYDIYDLPESFLLNYGIKSIGRNDSLFPEQYLTFLKVLKPDVFIEAFDTPLIERFKQEKIIEDHNLGFLNANYILSSKIINTSQWELVDSGVGCIRKKPEFYIYKKKIMSSYITVVDEVLFEGKTYNIQQKMRENSISNKKTAFILGHGKNHIFNNNGLSILEIFKNTNEIVINLDVLQDSFIIISESYHSGWQAEIDDVETEVHPTNVNFMGLFVPKGASIIRLKFIPSDFYLGIIISFITLLMVLIGWVSKKKQA